MFLKNKNIIFKIRRSKDTDYAALNVYFMLSYQVTIEGNTMSNVSAAFSKTIQLD